MKLHLQPNDWSCIPTSFGMILDLTPKEMFERIGHDGSEIVRDDVDEPFNRRSFHPQECIAVCLQEIVYPVPLEVAPAIFYFGQQWILPEETPIKKYLELRDAVILGTKDKKSHAVAWSYREQKCFDPVGMKYPLEDFSPELFYFCF